MQNNEVIEIITDEAALQTVISAVRKDERKDRALAVSARLSAIAMRIHKLGLNGAEAAQLLHDEAERYENESRELH